MTKFEKETIIEIVLYILKKTEGTDIYHLLKIIYFANQKHLLNWGTNMIDDNFHAYEYGPVPDQLYKACHENDKYGKELPIMFGKAVKFAGEDAPNSLLALREPNMDYLSQATKESVDESIRENAHLTFGQLLKKSHDKAWEKAWASAQQGKSDMMDTLSIAEAAAVSNEMREYIREQLELDEIFA